MKPLHSSTDYLQARFSVVRLVTFAPMHYNVYVNPRLASVRPSGDALQAVIAHELEHVCWYRSHSRWRWLTLIALVSEKKQEKFEKAADRGAIARGYASGLAEYRRWVYANVSPKAAAKKKRVYLTPEEIEASPAGSASH